ncbi:MAG: hypothetical protein HON90_14115 [Halobacteriovoraceae bacterium]|jgi:hypothetical protein|nr:hypothetical protein [Halobacteriovoraceae bacterium]
MSKLVFLGVVIIWFVAFGFFTTIYPYYQRSNVKYLVYALILLPSLFFVVMAVCDISVFSFSKKYYFLFTIFIFNLFMFIPFLFLTDLFTGIHDSVQKSPSIIHPEDLFYLIPPVGLDDIPDTGGPLITKDFKGLNLEFKQQFSSIKDNKIMFRGVYRTYVSCGSQLEIWKTFPSNFLFQLKNLNSKITYSTPSGIKNRSYDQKTLQNFGNMPCDQNLRGYFAINLYEILEDQSIPNGHYEVTVIDQLSDEVITKNMLIEIPK